MKRESADRIIEPVTLEEVKDHCGYNPENRTDDGMITRHITAMRTMLEGNLDMYIGYRAVEIFNGHPEPAVELPYRTDMVEKCFCIDEDGVPQDVPYEIVGTPKRLFLRPKMLCPVHVVVRVGFQDCPEDIRSAICDMVKAKIERAELTPVLEDAMNTLGHYRRYRI